MRSIDLAAATAWAVVALALAAYAYFFRGDFGGLRALAARRPPGWRRQRYRLWIAKAWLVFAGIALVGLGLIGRPDALIRLPSEFRPLASVAGYPIDVPTLAGELAIGIAAGIVLGGAWAWRRGRRGKRPAMLGDFSTLLPEDRAETWLAAGSALTAGIAEELFFRLSLPLAITLALGDAGLGFAIATAMFGLAHRYQGWIGMAATTLVGALFAFIYLQSGQLWLAMLVHAGVDLNSLVLRPWLAARARRKSA